MKKLAVVLGALLLCASLAFLAAGCGTDPQSGGTSETWATGSGGSATTATVAGDATTTSSPDVTAAVGRDAGATSSDKVFDPHELLSAEEAAALVGLPVSLEKDWYSKDEESGTISERYKYDMDSSTVFGLVSIDEDGVRTGDGSAKGDYSFTKNLVKSEITPVQLGDDAFYAGQGQLHLLYGSYYIVVAFDGDAYGTKELNQALNLKLGTKILENLKAKLG